MRVANSPLPFWYYCLECHARIYNMTTHDNLKIRCAIPHTATLGVEGDISSLCQYSWYDWCYYRDHTAKFLHNQEVLGRVLGPDHVMGMKWRNGCSRQMGKWYQDAHSGHSKLPRSIVTRKRRRGSYLTSLYMRDMVTQLMWSFRILTSR